MPDIQKALTGISSEDVDYANKIGQHYGLPDKASGGMGNKGDAARHVTLGYLAAVADQDRGTYNFTKNLVQLREYSPLTRRDVSDKMDMHNNAVGMQIAMLVGNDRQAFEGMLDKLMKTAKQVQTVDDFSSDYRSMAPVYIQPGYRLYVGGPSAMENKKVEVTKPVMKTTK